MHDLAQLKPFVSKNTIRVVVETPQGSRNKFAYDEDLGAFKLKKVLPEGMKFPYDFGFIPSTKADDGDPLDVLVLMDEAGTPGCVVDCRPVGIIEGEQRKGGKTTRNDRLIAVALPCRTDSDLRDIRDLNRTRLEEIEAFFVNYHQAYGRKFKVLGRHGPAKAIKAIKKALRCCV